MEFLYGKSKVTIDIPEDTMCIEKKLMETIQDVQGDVRRALEAPISSRPLVEIARGKKHAVIVVSDHTRPVPNAQILPPILSALDKAGVDDITILVATGIHAPMTKEAHEEILGVDMVAKYRVINHNALNMDEMAYLGKTPELGIPVYVNRLYMQADLKILTGLIEPHFMAGYSGGRKSVCPGICAFETVKYMHAPSILESPYATNGEIERNPFHQQAMWVAETAGVDFILNVVLDDQKRVSGVFAGDLKLAHAKGTEMVRRTSMIPVSQKVDLVVTSNGGYPLDRNYYQTVKGLVSAAEILEEGGRILMVSRCSDGLGSIPFCEGLELLKKIGDWDAYICHISDMAHYQIDQWEVEELVKVLRKAKIFLYSELSHDQTQLGFAQKVSSLEQAQQMIEEAAIQGEKIAAIPEGPYVVPVIGG